MKTCEYCSKFHEGAFASGRFCNRSCANGFSTKDRREEINQRVSKTLKESGFVFGDPFKKGFDIRRVNNSLLGKEERIKTAEWIKAYHERINLGKPWDELPKRRKYRIVKKEQDGKCLLCGIDKWNEKILVLEMDHIDGNRKNNSRENLRYLCPNCHSQTPTWKGRKNKFLGL